MKRLFKCLVLSLVLSMFLGMTSFAAVNSVKITSPAKKSVTITRAGKNVSKTIKATVKVSGKSSKALTFKSSDTDVATVTSKGKVTFKSGGKVTITVASKENPKKKATVKYTVKQQATAVSAETKSGAVVTKKGGVKIMKGKKLQVVPVFKPETVSNKKVTYKSSNKKIATVDKKGNIKGKKAGKAKITIKAADGSKKSFTFPVTVVTHVVKSVTFDKTEVSLNVSGSAEEKSAAITATVAVSGKTANKNLVWKSDNEDVAVVSQKGVITAVGAGTANVTATALDGSNKKATVKVTVIDYVPVASVALDKSVVTLASDADFGYETSAKLTATVEPSNATKKDVIFTSSNDKVAAVAEDGTITVKGSGSAVITATADDKSATANVVVVSELKFDLKYVKDAVLAQNTTASIAFADPAKAEAAINDMLSHYESELPTSFKNGRKVKNYTLQYDKKLHLYAGSNDVLLEKLAGANLQNATISASASEEQFNNELSKAHKGIATYTTTYGDYSFGNATVKEGANTYNLTDITFNATKDKSFTATVNNDIVKVRFADKFEGNTIYVSSTGDIEGIKASLKAILGDSFAEK